jgi:hypothetical protein
MLKKEDFNKKKNNSLDNLKDLELHLTLKKMLLLMQITYNF